MSTKDDPSIDWDASSTESLVDEVLNEFTDTFCPRREDSNLQLTRFYDNTSEGHKKGAEPSRPVQISNVVELKHFAEQPDKCQIFGIYQKNSYSRLYITYELFQDLISAYSIFPRIWDFVLPFQFRLRESDVGHAPFKFHQLKKAQLGNQNIVSFECAYSFRYAVLNHRYKQMDENPDYDAWSIRQTTVYQKYHSDICKTTFVLIAPSDAAKAGLEAEVIASKERGSQPRPFVLHQALISVLKENWRLYIRELEHILKDQSDRVTLAKIQSETERLSPLPELVVDFIDRQRIKRIEEKILNLMVIFDSLHDTLSQLQRQCRRHCLGPVCEDCRCHLAIEDFEEQINETRLNLKKTEVLHKRVQGIAQMLSDLLQYENSKSLNGILEETRDEHGKMRVLTERSTRDAAAVKILTVITLIYLPMTVVANFFSTQLIHVDDNGTISVAKDSWWFAVVAVPLTVATFLAWKYWLYSAIKAQDRGQEASPTLEKWPMESTRLPSLKIQEPLKWIGKQFSALWNHRRNRSGISADLP